MIKLEDVSLQFDDKLIFKDLNYTFKETGFYVIQGETGTGKSSLLNCIFGHYKINKGKIVFSSGFQKEKELYYNVSEFNLIPTLTVKENAKLLFSKEKVNQVLSYLDKYDLNYLIQRKCIKLSSGEAQKISLIFALVRKAKITLLDEPLCNIDKESLPLFYDELREFGKTSLVIAAMHEPISNEYVTGLLEIKEGKLQETYTNFSISKDLKYEKQDLSWGKAFKNSLLLFLKRPKLIYFLFLLILFLTSYILTGAIMLLTTTDATLFARGLSVHSPQFTAEKSNYESLKKIEKVEIPYYIDRNFQNNISEIQFTSIYMTDELYLEGRRIILNSNDIYISDYLYAILLGNTFEKGKNLYLPKEPLKEYIPTNLEIKKEYDSFKKQAVQNTNFVIYKTDYEQHLPEKNSINYSKDLDTFKQLVDQYYLNIYTTPKIVAELYTTFGEFSPTGFLLTNWHVQTNPYSLMFSLNENEFYCSKGFLKQTLGFSEEEIESSDFLSKVNGRVFQIEFQTNTQKITKTLKLKCFNMMIVTNGYEDIYLSDSMLMSLYDELNCQNGRNIAIITATSSLIDFTGKDFPQFVEEALDNEKISFIQRPIVESFIEARDNAKGLFAVLISIASLVIAFIFMLYGYFYVRNEMKELAFLQKKGYGFRKMILSRFLIQVCLAIVVIVFSVVALFSSSPFIFKLFHMI